MGAPDLSRPASPDLPRPPRSAGAWGCPRSGNARAIAVRPSRTSGILSRRTTVGMVTAEDGRRRVAGADRCVTVWPCSNPGTTSQTSRCGRLRGRRPSLSGNSSPPVSPCFFSMSGTGRQAERTSCCSCGTGARTWTRRGFARSRSPATPPGHTGHGLKLWAPTSRSSPTGTARRFGRSASRSSRSACATSRRDPRS